MLAGLLLFLVLVYDAHMECPPSYKCNRDDLGVFEAYNKIYKCPPKTLCNINKNEPCNACIPAAEVCQEMFTCLGNDTVEVQSIKLQCPLNYKCNADSEQNCQPCVAKPCDRTLYSCKGDIVVFPGNLEFPCFPMKCNDEFLQPCHICVAK